MASCISFSNPSRVAPRSPHNPVNAVLGSSMAWVYVVQNAEGRFYVGMTTHLEERLNDHNSGVSTWTKNRYLQET